MSRPSHPRAFVIGHPIAHSRSPMLHGFWLEQMGIAGSYEARDVPRDELAAFFGDVRRGAYVGGNVTVPHKTAVIPHLDKVDDAAHAIGAVNTVWREGDALVGGNTDSAGFLGNLDERAQRWDAGGRVAVVLGAGGAARAAAYGLLQRGFEVRLVNRTVGNAAALAAYFGPAVRAHGWDDLPTVVPTADLLINTTSLGMLGKPPLQVDLAGLKPSAVVNDIVYVPLETGLLKSAQARGLRTVDGLGMLLHQAVDGFEHWFGVRPAVTQELRTLIEGDIRTKTPGA